MVWRLAGLVENSVRMVLPSSATTCLDRDPDFAIGDRMRHWNASGAAKEGSSEVERQAVREPLRICVDTPKWAAQSRILAFRLGMR